MPGRAGSRTRQPAPATAGARAGSWLGGTIEQSAYLGTSISYQVRTDGGQRIVVTVPRTQDRLRRARSVDVRWRSEDALVLGGPATSGDEKEEPR